MSSELPPERLGLSKSFDVVTPQERRDDETLKSEVDEDNESDNNDHEPASQAHPDDVGEGADKEQKSEGPVDMTEEDVGHVYMNRETAEFAFEIDEGASYTTAKWMAVFKEGDVRELTPLSSPSQSRPVTSGRDLYTVELQLDVDDEFLEKKMYIVLDGSDDFTSFALRVFGVAGDPTARAEFEEQLQAETKTVQGLDDLNGGFTQENSPWYRTGLSTTDSEDDDDSSDSKQPGGGTSGMSKGPSLSTGAKAGIGVGVGVAGLILIGLAIFFFLRRRRKRAATTDKSLTPANDYMRDKEVHAAQVAETPHSPASEDDNRPRDSAFVAAGDAPSPPPADRSSAVATPSSEQRDVPHSVAHLVEEGMTEEQIRRLEEEERALDQAIERAGRG